MHLSKQMYCSEGLSSFSLRSGSNKMSACLTSGEHEIDPYNSGDAGQQERASCYFVMVMRWGRRLEGKLEHCRNYRCSFDPTVPYFQM